MPDIILSTRERDPKVLIQITISDGLKLYLRSYEIRVVIRLKPLVFDRKIFEEKKAELMES